MTRGEFSGFFAFSQFCQERCTCMHDIIVGNCRFCYRKSVCCSEVFISVYTSKML